MRIMMIRRVDKHADKLHLPSAYQVDNQRQLSSFDLLSLRHAIMADAASAGQISCIRVKP
jgi:hypothetical protein